MRQDNADLRLREIGYEIGLVTEEQYQYVLWKEQAIEQEIKRLESTTIGVNEEVQKFLEMHESTLLKSGITLAELVRRPELDYEMLAEIDGGRPKLPLIL